MNQEHLRERLKALRHEQRLIQDMAHDAAGWEQVILRHASEAVGAAIEWLIRLRDPSES